MKCGPEPICRSRTTHRMGGPETERGMTNGESPKGHVKKGKKKKQKKKKENLEVTLICFCWYRMERLVWQPVGYLAGNPGEVLPTR